MNNEMLMKRLDEVIVTDATDTTPSSFLATHIPFKNLRYTKSGQRDDQAKHITEDEFLREYSQLSTVNHQLIIVEGTNGSGKSHLIRWLLEQYNREKDSNEVVIAIRRHQNTLKGALSQILQADVFQGEEYQAMAKKLDGARQQLEDGELIYAIKNSFLTKLEAKRDFEDCELNDRENKKLVEFLKHTYTFENLFAKEHGPLRRIEQKISSNDEKALQDEFDARFSVEDFDIDMKFLGELRKAEANTKALDCARDLNKRDDFKQRVVSYLNTMVSSVIQLCTNLNGEDFMEIIYTLRKELKKQNKVLTLFVEDITSFTGIDRSLLEALLVDHQSKPEICKLSSVVGITSTYYKDYVPDNIKQRVTGRLLISAESVFEKEEDIISLAARYLNAINTPKESLEKWFKENAELEQLPVTNLHKEHKWSLYNDELLGEVSLFPFNEKALINLFNGLSKADRTPRIVLKEVIKYVYSSYLSNPQDFPGGWKEFQNYFAIPRWKELVHERWVSNKGGQAADIISCIVRVWGDQTVYEVHKNDVKLLGGLPKEIFDTFGVPFINGVEVEGVDARAELVGKMDDEAKNNLLLISDQKEQPLRVSKITGDIKKVVIEPIKREAPISEIKEVKITPFDKEIERLREWYHNDGQLGNHKDLRRDIAVFLYGFIDWQAEGISGYWVEQFFGKSSSPSISRISIEGQSVEIIEDGLVLDRNSENYEFLQALMAYKHLGNNSWYFKNATYYLLGIYNWINNNQLKLIELINNNSRYTQNDILRWAIYNQYILLGLDGAINGDETAEELYLKMIDDKSRHIRTGATTINQNHSAKWNDEVTKIKKEMIQDNYDLLINSNKIIQGEATVTNGNCFLDTTTILKEIRNLMNDGWEMQNLEISNTKKGSIYHSYNLLQKLQQILSKMVQHEEGNMQVKVAEILKYVQLQQVEHSVERMKNYVNDVIYIKARRRFSYEQMPLLTQEPAERAASTKAIIETISILNKLEGSVAEKVVALSKTSNKLLELYVTTVKTVDLLARGEMERAQNTISENKASKEKIVEIEESTKKALRALRQINLNLGKEE